ncbi:macrod1 protein [Capsaspora owczarzaki ATCC 30864]|uniref:Macrod1 protein n=2 Tax=Capsaspora owczarzaki (strain ATCC 30864) TaxID=595528 RepID=A0A0D2WLG7_CAPO3|nr:macrod1 protein [Capsaspora owczarzaki ATCC 30864]
MGSAAQPPIAQPYAVSANVGSAAAAGPVAAAAGTRQPSSPTAFSTERPPTSSSSSSAYYAGHDAHYSQAQARPLPAYAGSGYSGSSAAAAPAPTKSLQERRKTYRCGSDFVLLKSIPTWERYAAQKVPASKEAFFDTNLDLAAKISLWRGDITTLEIDAIVNAANESLLGGGGVDGSIHRAAGSDLRKYCETRFRNGCRTGQAEITPGFRLPASYVIHTVGPIGEKPQLLQSCYEKSLDQAMNANLRTVAFCCISTGVYGYPPVQAAHVALHTTRRWLEANSDLIDRIIFCTFLESDDSIYRQLLPQYFPITQPLTVVPWPPKSGNGKGPRSYSRDAETDY